MGNTNPKQTARLRRKLHIKKHVRGTAERPRLTVFRTKSHIYVQVIDDSAGTTLVSASTQSAELKDHEGHRGNKAAASAVGKLIAEKAKAAGIESVRFDRNGFLYHGRIQALADAAREGGLKF